MNLSTIKWIVIAMLGIALPLSVNTCSKQASERKIAEQNVIALASDIETYETRNGELAIKAQGLELSNNDLKKVNNELYEDLQSTKVKLRNSKSAIQVKTEYKYSNDGDSIKTVKRDSTLLVNLDYDYIKLNAIINNSDLIINPGNLTISIPNTQTLITAVEYKGWWIFKRKTGINITVVNSNRLITTNSVFYVQLE